MKHPFISVKKFLNTHTHSKIIKNLIIKQKHTFLIVFITGNNHFLVTYEWMTFIIYTRWVHVKGGLKLSEDKDLYPQPVLRDKCTYLYIFSETPSAPLPITPFSDKKITSALLYQLSLVYRYSYLLQYSIPRI